MTRCPLLALACVLAAGCGDERRAPASSSPLLPVTAPPATGPTVTVRGSVFDRDRKAPVGDVDVVFVSDRGEATTRARGDGTFELTLPRGRHRAFVRDTKFLTTGLQGRERLRVLPTAALANARDEMLMPVIELDADVSGLELGVTSAATINGLISHGSRPVVGAVVHAIPLESPSTGTAPTVIAPTARRAAPRPALGTDTAVTGPVGEVTLRVPPGRYEIAVSHPDFAGVDGLSEVELGPGEVFGGMFTVERGCIVSGRVIGIGGAPPHDGAIEMRSVVGGQFGPSGRVDPDGTFRWTTTDDSDVSLRAWPWKSPPSPPQTFACRDGKRFDGVVMRVGNSRPDLGGTTVDAQGDPVPLAYLDVQSLDVGVLGQQERADAGGAWHVYDMPAGRYRLTTTAPGHGVASQVVLAPRTDIRLQLSGTGRLAGTTTDLVDGSFELTLHHCGPAADPIELEDDVRLVVVRGGRFSIDRVPACAVTFTARWRDRVVAQSAVVEPERTTYIELGLGGAREKTVRGTVRDSDGNPVRDARVTALVDNREATSVRTDAAGRFSLTTQSGALLVAGNGSRAGRASVGRANVATEQVDLVLDQASVDWP